MYYLIPLIQAIFMRCLGLHHSNWNPCRNGLDHLAKCFILRKKRLPFVPLMEYFYLRRGKYEWKAPAHKRVKNGSFGAIGRRLLSKGQVGEGDLFYYEAQKGCWY